MHDYIVVTTKETFAFEGKFRKDLETNNWHYYERHDGVLLHFRKEHMVAVKGDTAETILENSVL